MGGCSLPFGSDEPDLSLPVVESPASQPFPQPFASPPPQPNPILIQPTNPEQRLRMLKGGRADPFQALVPPAKAPTSSSQSSTKAKASDRSTTALKAYTRFLDRVGGQFEQRLSPPTQTVARSRSKSSAVEAPTSTFRQATTARSIRSPVRPQPNTARGVQVTGVILVAGVPKAIVKVPGETLSQSVSRGDCLVKGQVSVIVSQSVSHGDCLVKGRVLVKRIDVNRSESIVILEQYGTEVAIGVGKKSL